MRPLHLLVTLSLFLLFGTFPALHAAPAQKPNIVFFLVDDLGLGDVGCFGSTFHETPHIDRLCAEGMKFTQAYSACTVCSPSRAAILLGKYPGRTNLTDWIAGHRRKNPKLRIPDWNMRMNLEETTLAEALTAGGYRSQFVGKWHLMPIGAEDFDQHFPTSHGFEINIAGREWGQPKGPGKYFPPFGMPNLDDGDRERGDFLTTSLTDEAVKFIENASAAKKEDPFFLYFSYYTVHGPIMAPPDLVKKYEAKARSFEKPHTERVHPAFAAMTERLDDSVGRVRAKLEERGLADNTAIVFTSDNGGTSELASAGLRGAKALAYEGGTRVATMVYWPGVTRAGSECAVPIIGNDFYPTLLEMAGLDALPDQHVDGLSLVPLLKGESDAVANWERDALYWHYPHYHRTTPYGAVRQGDWKLIEFFENGDLELYHLGEDPAERNNRVSTDPEKAAALLKNLQAWRKSVDAQMPNPNPDFDPALGAKPKGGARPRLKGKARPTKPISTPFGDISASSNQAGNPPEKAVDGDRTTRWAANGDGVPQWIQLDFGEPKSLTGVEIHFKNKTWIHYQVDVSADGGKEWEKVHESKTDQPIQDETVAFEAKGNRLRVTVNDLGSGWVTISEMAPKFVGE